MRFLASVLTVSVVFSLSVARGQSLLYPPSDPAKDIAAALTAAATEHKRVLIDFGADWCPDCRVLGALFEDPQVVHRGMKLDLPSKAAKKGSIPGVRTPIVIDGWKAASENPAPLLGQHTDEILKEIGEA